MAGNGAADGDHVTQEVPLTASLTDDAPGYGQQSVGTDDGAALTGPVCWKCAGTGVLSRRRKATTTGRKCPVCDGAGRLPPKARLVAAVDRPGEITRAPRGRPADWVAPGPPAVGGGVPQRGEQLCQLVGSWRIFQRVAGHRWTTDDLMTAWVAGRAGAVEPPSQRAAAPKRCLDLGCGNGSVLLMNAWQFPDAACVGVEARSHAAGLARRSIAHNMGTTAPRAVVRSGDFRAIAGTDVAARDALLPEGPASFDLVSGTPPYFKVNFTVDGDATPAAPPTRSALKKAARRERRAKRKREASAAAGGDTRARSSQRTGDGGPTAAGAAAHSSNGTGAGAAPAAPAAGAAGAQAGAGAGVGAGAGAGAGTTVAAAGTAAGTAARSVRLAAPAYGGLPSCKQSAPARCEFRGGVEAYCAAAAVAMAPGGRFVVCENSLNHGRVVDGAAAARLAILKTVRVIGRVGKEPLFDVFVMAHAGEEGVEAAAARAPVHQVVVRDDHGDWTPEYKRILGDMGWWMPETDGAAAQESATTARE